MPNDPELPEPESQGSAESAPEEGVEGNLEVHPKDSFHRIIFGQVEEPLFPAPHPPVETPEDELTRAAMSDPAAHTLHVRETPPTFWRFLVLTAVVVVALGIVFWKR